MPDYKASFIVKKLSAYHEKLKDRIRSIAKRKGIGVTDEGINSIAYQVAQSGEGAVSQMSFKEYLRMVDMGAGRAHPVGGLSTSRTILQASRKKGYSTVKDKVRRPKTFLYSKNAYGLLTGLENDLLYGYTEEAIEEIKTELLKTTTV